MREGPLVVFTLAGQAAAGAYAILAGLQLVAGAPPVLLDLRALLALALVVLLGMAASLLHLGAPQGAYRALRGLRTSWLSREVLAALFFAACLAVQAGATLWGARHTPASLALLTALAGLALIYCMARAYMLRTMAAWDTPAVLFSFLTTAAVLGSLGALVLAPGAREHGPALLWLLALAAAADIALGVGRLRRPISARYGAIRASARPHAGLAALHAGLLIPSTVWAGWALVAGRSLLPALALALAAEVAGRAQFYRV